MSSLIELPHGKYLLNHLSDPTLATPDPNFHSGTNPVRTAVVSTGDYIIPLLPPVRDQGQIGSCAANAGSGALEILLFLEGQYVPISALHWYWTARMLDGSPGDQDTGTYLRSICQQGHKIGVCAETIWPYVNVETNFKVPPPVEAGIRASENRIYGYYKITSSGAQRLYDIATAVRANHPVVFGTQVGDAVMNTDGKTPVAPNGNMAGGHAMGFVGVQSIAGRMSFRVKNSWGPQFADGGYFWMDQDYINYSYTGDIWVMTRMRPIL